MHPNTIARHAHVTGIGQGVVTAMGEFAAEAEAVAVEVLGGGAIGHAKERDGER